MMSKIYIKKELLIFMYLLIVGYLLVFRNYDLTTWHATHWLFSVQEGFYSRALIGSILQVIFPNYAGSMWVINAASFFVVILLTTILSALSYKYWLINRNHLGLLICLVLITSPGTIQFFANDGGRFDQIGYIIIILVAFYLPKIPQVLQLIIVSVVSILLVLLHEAVFLLVAPVLAAVYLAKRINDGKTIGELIKVLAPLLFSLVPAVALASIMLPLGKLDKDPSIFNQKLLNLQELATFEVSGSSLMVQFRTLSDNFYLMVSSVLNTHAIVVLFFSTISLIPSLLVGFILLKNTLIKIKSQKNNIYSKTICVIIISCCFAPLLLAFIGLDYPRWIAAVVTNLFLVGIITSVQNKVTLPNSFLNLSTEASYYLYTFIVMFSLAVGPIFADVYTAPRAFHMMLYMFKVLLNYLF